MSALMKEYDDSCLEQLAKDMFEDAHVLSVQEVSFSCPCSKERMERALSTLLEKDLKAMIEEDQGAKVTCNFCNERYEFTEQELQSILDKRHEKNV